MANTTITTVDSPDSTPIAKVASINKIIYLKETSDKPKKPINLKSKYVCPYCKTELAKTESYLYHIKNNCVAQQTRVADISYQTDYEISPIPLEMHNIIFVSGPPRSGKTYWVNMYATAYKKIFERDIFYFTRNKSDDSLNEKVYTKILTSEIERPIQMDDIENSLCIFDDIEDSQHPLVTKYLYTLLDDITKNGRHAGKAGISVIFCNQETTMYRRTKTILSQMTEFVFFPNYTSKHSATYVLEQYLGLDQQAISYIYTLPSRWVSVRRIAPQYIISQHNIFLVQ